MKKSLLIMLLMAVFAPLAIFGQETLTVCEGTTTNEYVPFYGYYADATQQNQMIFPAMRDMNGSNITEMVFDCYQISSAYNGGLGNWIVSLGETDATTLSGLDNTTALTQVYSGELTVNASAKQVIVTFTTPYLYNGGNLLVEFNHPVTTGYRRIYFYGTEATSAAYTYSAVRNFLPQTTFTYLPADYCFTPSGITSETTPVSATIDWNPEAEAYNVRYRVNANSQAEVLLSADFENGLPTGWGTIDNDGDGYEWTWSEQLDANSGSGLMYSASYINDSKVATRKEEKASKGALTPDNWLVTPQVALGGTISLYAKGQDASWCGEHFAIYVSTTSQTDTRSFTQVSQEYVATGSYQEYVIDLSNYSGNGYIAIRHFNITDMFYLDVDDVTVYGPATQNAWTTINNITKKPYTIEGLTPETTYDVEVQAVCSSTSSSDWSETAQFTTTSNCVAPFDLQADEITQATASLNWTGYQDSYNVRYRTAADAEILLFNDFESSVDSWTQSDGGIYNGQGMQYSGSYMYGFNAGEEQYLITPELTGLEDGGTLVFYHMYYSNTAESFMVGYSSTTADARAFTWSNSVTSGSSYSAYVEAIPAGTKYIAIQTTIAQYYLFIEDFTVYGPTIPAGEWITISNITTPVSVANLEAQTYYEFQVQGINPSCDGGVTNWSESGYFTTATGNMFITDGNWNEANNWYAGEVPATGADVTIAANCTIPAGYIANAGAITIGENGSLTIQDGGQLIHTNEGVVATMEKEIKGYTGEKDSYYFISSPANTVFTYNGNTYAYTDPAEVENMLSNEYDLYGFDCTEDLEWRNYEADPDNFVMWQGMGYLYANSEKTTLRFTGELHPFASDYANDGYLLTYEASDENFNGFNLVGNMLAADAYIVIANYESGTGTTGLAEDVYFYTMGDGELVAGTGAVAPLQGVMVKASSASQVALCYTKALRSKSALNITLSNANGLIDAAYIRFNGGSELNKIQLNPNHTKLFFTKDNQDLAVVNSEAQGEMPVSFKAENNGTYTLSFSNENVEFSYLHLIDNMTGADVDLLANPSYSFEAKTTDYASRFKLVFSTENASSDHFAYFTDGSLVINNEGNATMNVYDVTGRLVNTQSINGSCQVGFNAIPGVYMIQLVNGNDAKTQKIVVK
jgi:hypothetical protein